ncbi:hypothetical protein MEO94_12215 [Dolichospermum sp. ST_sed9]|nr:hypothetical protein [Dolichospermum sp. ST_sed9]
MEIIIFPIVLFSHICAAWPFYCSLQAQKLPNIVDFAVISVILYYDFGIAIELFGLTNTNNSDDPFFSSFFSANGHILIQAWLFLLLTPWLFRLGYSFANKKGKNIILSHHIIKFSISRQNVFYILAIFIAIGSALLGYKNIITSDNIWSSRAKIGEELGSLIIILSFPMHFLSFYIRTSDALTKKGLVFSLFLVLTSILSTITVGQRTNLLLPILIILLFRSKITFTKIAIFFMVGIIATSTLLPLFKWQYTEQNLSIVELAAVTIQGDLSRSYILTSALERTEPIGTKIFPYPMAGYIYVLLFYIPRQIAPFKGWSTAQYYTSDVVNMPVEKMDWGFGIGVIEELLLNVGFWWCIPGLIVYGMCMGVLDRLSWRIPSLIVPTRLAATWLCGYDLAALTLTFGTMAIIGLFLDYLFRQKSIYVPKLKLSEFSS